MKVDFMWAAHNLISHPLSEIAWWITRSDRVAGWIHDATIPEHEPGTGRG